MTGSNGSGGTRRSPERGKRAPRDRSALHVHRDGEQNRARNFALANADAAMAAANGSVTRCSRPSPTFSDLLGRSVRQVDYAQEDVRWRTTLARSPELQVPDIHVENARKVGVAIVSDHHSGRSRIQLSVGHHSKVRTTSALFIATRQ
jgi:hypothetical protein